MVLCRVAVGIQQKLLKSAPTLTGPSAGHHSVSGPKYPFNLLKADRVSEGVWPSWTGSQL